MDLGERIASARAEAGVTQQELAEMLFVSRELVSKWELGQRRPDESRRAGNQDRRISQLFPGEHQLCRALHIFTISGMVNHVCILSSIRCFADPAYLSERP